MTATLIDVCAEAAVPARTRTAAGAAVALVATFMASSGCPTNNGLDAGACTLAVQWIDACTGLEFADGSEAEFLNACFQGLVAIPSAVRIEGVASAPSCRLNFFVILDNGDEVAWTGTPPLRPDVDGSLWADDVRVPFNDSQTTDLLDHRAEIYLRVEAGGCTGDLSATVTLVDDVPCPPLGGDICTGM